MARTIPGNAILLLLALGTAPALAQRGDRASIAPAPKPSRIVLESKDVTWCYDQIHARVDLTAPVNRRMGLRVRIRASPRDVADVPGIVVARPWASFTIRGKHPLEMPAPMAPHATTVTLVAEANGSTATESFTIRSGPRARRECRDKIDRAEAYERMKDVNEALIDSENEQTSRKKGEAGRNPR